MQAEQYSTPSVAKAIAQIAADAGRAIMEIYEQPEAWNVEVKGDASPLTQADLRANDIIVAALARLAPEIPVLSEESPWTGGDVATYWAVDPLDGTKEFLKRNGEFTVNIALVVEGVAQLGVIYAPATGHLWLGVTGFGTWTIKLNRQKKAPLFSNKLDWRRLSLGSPTRTGGLGDSSPPIRVVESRSHNDRAYPDWLGKLICKAQVSLVGSSLKFCLVAAGDADCYLRKGPTSYWDTAAGHAILENTGGKVLSLLTREPLDYRNPSEPVNPAFLAFGPGIHIPLI